MPRLAEYLLVDCGKFCSDTNESVWFDVGLGFLARRQELALKRWSLKGICCLLSF